MYKTIHIIKNLSEIGAGTRGASLGFDAMVTAGHNQNNKRLGKYEMSEVENHNQSLFHDNPTPNAIRIKEMIKVYESAAKAVDKVIEKDQFPFVISGDHASAGGTIAGIKKAYPEKTLGVVWIDAHADLHSPYTSPSGNIHGMPLATALASDNKESQVNELKPETANLWNELKSVSGIAPKVLPEHLVFYAVRDTEQPEDDFIARNNIKNFKVSELRNKGVSACVNETLTLLNDCDIIYISFDVDSMDCDLISHGTGTPVPDGLTQAEATDIMKGILDSNKVVATEFVEINPTLDEKKNKMADTAFEIFESLCQYIETKQ